MKSTPGVDCPMTLVDADLACMIFDLDGTLVDSVPRYFRVMEETLRLVGLPPAPRSLISEFMTGGIPVLGKMVPADRMKEKNALVEEMISVGRQLSKEMFHNEVRVFDGVGELFSILTRRGIRLGLVTSTHRAYIDRKMIPLKRMGLADALSEVVVIEDAPRKKPAPDPLLVCADRLSVSPERCSYVGDAHVDIRAGNAAGMKTVGVLTGLDDRETLEREHPTMILERVADLIQSV